MTRTNVVGVAVLATIFNIILQVFVRILSSLSNAIIFRLIAQEALGVINVRLLLLYSTCHCLSREAFRRSCLSTFDKNNLTKKFNLLWFVVPACFICSLLMCFIWLYVLRQPDSSVVQHYSTGVIAVVTSVFIECLAEPLYVFSQSFHFVKLKVVMEGLMLTIRSFCMVLCLWKWPDHAIYCFCFSQIFSSVIYTASFYTYFICYLNSEHQKKEPLLINSIIDVFPKFSRNYITKEDGYLLWSFFGQTLFKQLLTEGERYVMTFFNQLSFAEQGLYDVVNNLGSLAARFIFLPIEDSTYLIFTQLLTRDKASQTQEKISLSLRILEKVLKLMILIGLTILVFGFSYSQLLLHLYGGSKLSIGLGLTLMRWHCVYVLFLAINGVTEGFKFAVMDRTQINEYNKKLVWYSLVFLAAGWCLVNVFGSPGFIIANCLNMLIRIYHSLIFIQEYFRIPKYWWWKIAPNFAAIAILVASLVFTAFSERHLCCGDMHLWMCHLGIGSFFFFVYLDILWCKEKELAMFVFEHFKKGETPSKKQE